MALGHPDTAHVNRCGRLDRARATDELGRPAADVDDEERTLHARRDEVAGCAEERQPGLLDTADHLGRDVEVAERLAHTSDELVSVGGIPGCGGGDEADVVHGILAALLGVFARHRQRAGQRVGRQHPGLVDPVAQPDDLHPTHDVGESTRPGVDISDQQPNRVGAAVD